MQNKQMIIRLDKDTKDKLAKLAKAEGKNSSMVIRELIESYVQERDIENYIDDLWDRIGKKLKQKRVTEKDIAKAIKELTREKH